MAGKPEKKIKEPEGPKHAPKPKKPRHPLLAAAAIGATLIGGSCAPSARAQETTPSRPAAMVQSPDVRVASAEVREPQRGAQAAPSRPQPVVAQAPAQPQVRSDTTAGTRWVPDPTGRVYDAFQPGEQPQVLSGEEFRREYAYTFQNRLATIRDLPTRGKLTMSEWEIEIIYGADTPILELKVTHKATGYETHASATPGAKVVELPFPETEYARGPMLAIVEPGGSVNHFVNKVSNCITAHLFGIPGYGYRAVPEIGTDVYNGEPYLILAPPGSLTADGDMRPGTRFYQYNLISTAISTEHPDGPGAGAGYFERGRD